jgi:hypothetical protein
MIGNVAFRCDCFGRQVVPPAKSIPLTFERIREAGAGLDRSMCPWQ